MPLPFHPSVPGTLGVELELQLVDAHTGNLATDAGDLLRRVETEKHPGEIKPEITQSMIEINTGVQQGYAGVLADLQRLREVLTLHAQRMNVRIAGGGTHPFQKWSERRIYPTVRFEDLSDQYGYLAKLFTIFGQHIHIGCSNGDDAIYLTHALSRYIPHFIALSASSPFYQGVDTAFQSSRLSVVNAFPLSGVMPTVTSWSAFEEYFNRLRKLGIVRSMKDFYWDIRPKPEYGTVEIRVCDTPLTVERAAAVAAYAQALAAYLLAERPLNIAPDFYLLYAYHRFQSCRYGLQGTLYDAETGQKRSIAQDILDTLTTLEPCAAANNGLDALTMLRDDVIHDRSDAGWLRETYASTQSLPDLMRLQSQRWMTQPAS